MHSIQRRRAICVLAFALLACLALPCSATASAYDDFPFSYRAMLNTYSQLLDAYDGSHSPNSDFAERVWRLSQFAKLLREADYPNATEAEQWDVYAQGFDELANGRFDTARERFQAVAPFKEADAFLSYLAGREYEAAGDLELAIGAFQMAAEHLKAARDSYEELMKPDNLRKLLEGHIADKSYAEAIEFVEAYAAQLQDAPDVEKYAAYAKAMVELDAGKLKEAEALFAGIAGFLDADAMRLDVAAYTLQQSGDLRGAIDQYHAAQASAKADGVKESDALYFADRELHKAQQALYDEATDLYEAGDRNNAPETLGQAKELFLFLGSFADCEAKAVEVQGRIDRPRHVLGDGVIDRETTDSMRFSFSDTAAGPYRIRYYPTDYGYPVIEREIATPSVTLDGLLPSMSYTIEAEGSLGDTNALIMTGQTLTPAADTVFSWDTRTPFVTLFTYRIADEAAKGWDQIAQDTSGTNMVSETAVRLPERGTLAATGVSYGLKYSCVQSRNSGRQIPFTATTLVVLTVPGVGVVSEVYDTTFTNQFGNSAAVHLGNLFDELYATNPNGLARASRAEVSIYVDGLYAFTCEVALERP